jgi:hypothetical protein
LDAERAEIAGAPHILGMRALYLAGDNMQTLATIERREVTIRQDESDPKGFPARCGTFDKLEQEVSSWGVPGKTRHLKLDSNTSNFLP